ncbi:unnamed protein product [Nippostrongylus brasiliensis]|uniref:Phlebovirus_G2 domain-containing protein n=1 Tax=Nippostrongylus brasiliensis TaxID=27835 RepID=A0A0N4XKU3_NIPBR|nr:unnamed protein product [Nippostrongylus brasiliensis]
MTQLLFNSVQSTMCIQLRHGNASIGHIKVQRKAVIIQCSKVSHFWTKETVQHVDYQTRCRGMGSCNDQTCENINLSNMIPEFNHTTPYPSYTACSVEWPKLCLRDSFSRMYILPCVPYFNIATSMASVPML